MDHIKKQYCKYQVSKQKGKEVTLSSDPPGASQWVTLGSARAAFECYPELKIELGSIFSF